MRRTVAAGSARWISAIALTAMSLAAGVAHAGEAASDTTAGRPLTAAVTYASRYVFQGLDYSDGRPVVEPEFSASAHGWSVTGWGNVDQTRQELNEIDLNLGREWSAGPLSGSVGYGRLWYPHRDWEATHEVIAGLSAEAPLAPTADVHWDVGAGRGRYWSLGASQALPWWSGAVSLGSQVFVHDHYYGMTGVPALETSVRVSTGWRGLTLQPSLARQWTWANGDFRGDQAVRPGWVAGLRLSAE